MFWIHPCLQSMVTVLACCVLFSGWGRFVSVYYGKQRAFSWKRHVGLGKYTHILWMVGLLLGQYSAANYFGENGTTGIHYWIGQAMMPCIALGYISGIIMDRDRKERLYLPRIHAACNICALLLACAQFYTGFLIMRAL